MKIPFSELSESAKQALIQGLICKILEYFKLKLVDIEFREKRILVGFELDTDILSSMPFFLFQSVIRSGTDVQFCFYVARSTEASFYDFWIDFFLEREYKTTEKP